MNRRDAKRRVGLLAAVLGMLFAYAGASGEPVPTYSPYTDWRGWARLRIGVQAGMAASYDRNLPGNLDFSQYESLADGTPLPPEPLLTAEWATVATMDGPGLIHRFWMPHLAANRVFSIRLYFDGEVTPRIDTTSNVLLGGSYTLNLFKQPLVDTFAGGQVSYEPIPFRESIRIEMLNKALPAQGWSPDRNYYQYSYSTYAPGTDIESYTGGLSGEEEAARDEVVALFNNPGLHPDGPSGSALASEVAAVAIAPSEELVIASISGPGIIRAIKLLMPAGGGTCTPATAEPCADETSDDPLAALRLKVTYDASLLPAIDVPVGAFFGADRCRAPFASLPIGSNSAEAGHFEGGFYSFWPMPFRDAVSVALVNTSGSPIDIDGARVEYELEPVAVDMAYLRAEQRTSIRVPGQTHHPIMCATGRGHYVGNFLYARQDNSYFQMLEGDELIRVDGEAVIFGTGLEDAYNGGYYYNWVGIQGGEPEGPQPQSAIRPLNGILFVGSDDHDSTAGICARADQYRWYIADAIPFTRSIDVRIENKFGIVGAEWTSVAFWYHQPAIGGDTDADGDLDLGDFAGLQRCFAHTDGSCLAGHDLDDDGDVDLNDVAAFTASMTGAWPVAELADICP